MRFVAVALLVTLVVACDSETPVPAPPDTPGEVRTPTPAPAAPSLATARRLYRENCLMCHGEKGRGDGLAAEYLSPRPRNFPEGAFRLRSTANGSMPTDEDLLRTITRGIPGSSMPSFEFLSEPDRKALVAHVKALTVLEEDGERLNIFEMRGDPRKIEPGTPPKKSEQLIARGKAVYVKKGCAACHGETGAGDGLSAPTLKDSEGHPIPPANFSRGVFKGGDDVRDIYLRFTTGMDGTPMPSFETSLSDDDRWALAYYVKSLVRGDQKPLVHSSRKAIRCSQVDSVPLDPEASEWGQAPVSEVPLMLLWQRSEAANYMTVRALRSGRHMGILMEWVDATVDGTSIRHEDFSDAVAVMFALTDPPGDIAMGSEDKPVNLWQWRFSRQLDLKAFQDVEKVYPNMASDDYYGAGAQYPKPDDFPGHLPITPAPDHDPTYLTGWGSGNSLSNPKPESAVEDLNAHGFGTLEPQESSDQDVEGIGVWKGGRWKVVIRRPLEGAGEDVDFSKKRVFLSFAAWDGGKEDRDGQKAVSYWQILKLD